MIGLRHSGLYVENLENMIDFYKETFHMTVASRVVERGEYIEKLTGVSRKTELDVCKMCFPDGGMLELIRLNRSIHDSIRGSLFSVGTNHIAITVDSVADIYEAIVFQGLKYISEPIINPQGTAKVFFTLDPEGNYLEIVEEIQRDE